MAFFGLIVFGAFMSIPLGISEAVGGGAVLVASGMLMVVFPFATPQTVQMLGVRASVVMTWVGGLAMFGFGVFLLTTST